MLVYDGDCGFCTVCARWIEARLPGGTPVVPWQSIADLAALGLTEDDVRRAAYWIDADGAAYGGHLAVARALVAAGGGWRVVGRIVASRPVAPLAAVVYRVVAANRHRLPGSTDACRVR